MMPLPHNHLTQVILFTVRYLVFHIRSAYSLIVRSLEKIPDSAILINEIPFHFFCPDIGFEAYHAFQDKHGNLLRQRIHHYKSSENRIRP